jgi:hypothetical protein
MEQDWFGIAQLHISEEGGDLIGPLRRQPRFALDPRRNSSSTASPPTATASRQ